MPLAFNRASFVWMMFRNKSACYIFTHQITSKREIVFFRPKSQAYESRLQQVQSDVDSTNSYHLTETELIYGAKLAWRNSARCIGRIQWSKLQVFIIERCFLISDKKYPVKTTVQKPKQVYICR